MERQNLLVTGSPGTGKTTIVARLIERLTGLRIAGFYTEEIRKHGVRNGFEIVDVRGMRVLLSHIDIRGNQRVGKYGVDVAAFERYLETVPFFSAATDLAIIDEIGKMECLSAKFRELVLDLLDSPVLTVATIALRGEGIIERVKQRPDVRLIEVTRENRDSIPGEIEKTLRRLLARERTR